MRYGLPYKGSKSQIAEAILRYLPSGKRLVDLFGGGGAISHCASYSYKWDSILYNEISPLVCKGFKMGIDGEYKNEKRWISREVFFRLKDTDPYVAFCFSFSNNMKAYAYSKEIESWKKALHYARVFKDNSLLKEMGIDSDGSRLDIKHHFKEYTALYGKWAQDEKHFSSLESLERLESLESLLPIEITNGSYLDYEYQDGDVVYCDPPYENTDCGGYSGFDSKTFYEWTLSRPYPVYFSSYSAPSDFHLVWEQDKRILGNRYNILGREKIYCNQEQEKTSLYSTQLMLF